MSSLAGPLLVRDASELVHATRVEMPREQNLVRGAGESHSSLAPMPPSIASSGADDRTDFGRKHSEYLLELSGRDVMTHHIHHRLGRV